MVSVVGERHQPSLHSLHERKASVTFSLCWVVCVSQCSLVCSSSPLQGVSLSLVLAQIQTPNQANVPGEHPSQPSRHLTVNSSLFFLHFSYMKHRISTPLKSTNAIEWCAMIRSGFRLLRRLTTRNGSSCGGRGVQAVSVPPAETAVLTLTLDAEWLIKNTQQ